MNNIKEMIKFADYLFLNNLPSDSILLWYTLRNMKSWVKGKESFQVPNNTLIKLTGFKDKKHVAEARNILVKNKLILYKPGKRGTLPVYQFIPFDQFLDRDLNGSEEETQNQSRDQSQDQSQDQFRDQFQDQSQDQSRDQFQDQSQNQSISNSIYNNQSIKRRRRGRRGGGASEELLLVFEQNFETLRPIVQDGLDNWCEKIGEEIVQEAIQLAVKNGGQKYSYIEKILQQWEAKDLRTVQQVREFANKQSSASHVEDKFSVSETSLSFSFLEGMSAKGVTVG
ncbi:DnaD domain-containing protein [Oceanobacillus halophilus]|uniref:DnaD domain protein n=1 Tax=Oceanobacillus halophilus TaxID=930130 RepID=A0A494ZV00_9BACI|nr:DnaD domain protein [Oceanobacillus halophilus]RKQ30016.1 DnaD domain protein [Oceanobacillus halophilus]